MNVFRSNIFLAATAVIFLAGCSTTVQTRSIKAPYTALTVSHAGLTAQEQAWADKNCPFGAPVVNSPADVGVTHVIVRDDYALEHSSREKIPLWVCEYVQKSDTQGIGDRSKSKFAPDPKLMVGERSELADYDHSGYDRGHQAPAADHKNSQKATDDTFYLSNMAPQKPGLNRQIWKQLETKVRNLVSVDGSAYVITGGLFYDPKEESPKTADGTVEYQTIGKDAVAVPTHFYKIVVYKSHGDWKATAYVLENKSYPPGENLANHITTVDWIQDRAGINFMPQLSDLEARGLEAQKGVPL